MIDIDELYRKTNNGLTILQDFVPGCDTKKPFRYRSKAEDSAPSARLTDKSGVWKLIDFGLHSRPQSPIDIVMEVEKIDFEQALTLLATRYGIDNAKPVYVGPRIEQRTALADEKDDDINLETTSEFSDRYLKILGPAVTAENAKALNWYVVNKVTKTKNGKTTIIHSTPEYPIFARRCYYYETDRFNRITEIKDEFFYKIYEPLNQDKSFRFSYAPKGARQKGYISGLVELYQAYKDYNREKELEFNSDPNNEKKTFNYKKLDECFIASGERDTLCIKSLGYNPIWFNSETADISGKDISLIGLYAETIYNIPDLDRTGVKVGKELAKKFWSIHTLWLPEFLTKKKDWRGNPKKDFKDYCDEYCRDGDRSKLLSDFKKRINNACPVQFWNETEDKSGITKYSINTVYLFNFLNTFGIHRLKDELSEVSKIIQMNENVVKELQIGDILEFINTSAEARALNNALRNMIYNASGKLSERTFMQTPRIELDFTKHTKDSQFLFFKNTTWQITASRIVESVFDKHVWDKNVINHHVSILDPMFKCIQKTDGGKKYWDIDILATDCCMLNYIINTSRIHWRNELEYNLEELSNEEANQYRADNKFSIKGLNLTEEEQREQKLNLVNKIFAIGYMLHSYKSDSRAWATFAMDSLGDDGECNGRSGKSFFFKALSTLLRSERIDGRMTDVKKSEFLFQNVDQYTDLLYIDDAERTFPIKNFYSMITSDLTVNPKNNAAFNIPFEQAPKIGFTTNYVPRDFDSSTVARLLFLVFSDYYHEQTDTNGYLENRSIRDDFDQRDLLKDYTDEEWNSDINFFAQCIQFYLHASNELNLKIQPPMEAIMLRKVKDDMGSTFQVWAEGYFDEESGNLNQDIRQVDVYEDFKRFAGNDDKTQMRGFTEKLKKYAEFKDYTYNPADISNKDRRIQKKVNGKVEAFIHIRNTSDYSNDGKIF